MSRKSGHRFSEKDMRQQGILERIPIGMRSWAVCGAGNVPITPDLMGTTARGQARTAQCSWWRAIPSGPRH